MLIYIDRFVYGNVYIIFHKKKKNRFQCKYLEYEDAHPTRIVCDGNW